jgi:hypothetical protein
MSDASSGLAAGAPAPAPPAVSVPLTLAYRRERRSPAPRDREAIRESSEPAANAHTNLEKGSYAHHPPRIGDNFQASLPALVAGVVKDPKPSTAAPPAPT